MRAIACTGTMPRLRRLGCVSALGAAVWVAGCGGSSSASSPVMTVVATPTFSVGPGTYASIQTVAISSGTPGATIYYTTNGSAPTTASSVYSGPVTVGMSETLEAIAVAAGDTNSAVASAVYVVQVPAATPTFSVAAGTYGSAQTVTISDATPGETIYYTTNGSAPTTASSVYSGPVTVGMSETLEAIAVAAGGSASPVASAVYVVSLYAAITGTVTSSGPVKNAHVYLFAANTAGYGQASVSLLQAAATGHSDTVGAYVLSGTDGSFSLTGSYSCTAGSQLYLYALDGDAGNGVNAAMGMLAALGPCGTSASPAVVAHMNEVTTIAAAYALAGFAVDAMHVASSGTALAQVGVANAFANAGNLVNLATGAALTTTPAGNGTVPQAEINTLANALAGCVETASKCSTLLSTATADGTATGAAATDTATAAINIAHHPGVNVAALFAAAGSAVYTPALSAQPGDFSILLTFTRGTLFSVSAVAIDGAGDAWAANGVTISKYSPLGAEVSPAGGYSANVAFLLYQTGLQSLSIDPSGNIWESTANGACEFTNSGVLATPGCLASGTANDVNSVSVDGRGDAWIAHTSLATLVEYSASGAVLSGSSGYSFGSGTGFPSAFATAIDALENVRLLYNNQFVTVSSAGGTTLAAASQSFSSPSSVVIDGQGNLWFSTGAGSLGRYSQTGVVTFSSVTGTGHFQGIGIDGAGNVWTASNTTYGSGLVEFSNAGAVLSPYGSGFYSSENGFGYAMLVNASGSSVGGVGVDGSGDVWVSASKKFGEYIGIAVPVVTPISAGVKNNALGTRP